MKSIDIVNEVDFEIDCEVLETIFIWLKSDGLFHKEDSCCVKFCDDNQIKLLNSRYRGKNTTTDVLSFPCIMTNIPFKGDIAININQATKQCQPHSIQFEVARLFIHALLHLSGMDHLSKQEQLHMTSFESKYNDKLFSTFKHIY
jgi:probable rRNA maturation factor